MEMVNSGRESSIISVDGSNNTNSNGASNTRPTVKDDSLSIASIESVDTKNIVLIGKNESSDSPPTITSSSATTDSDRESDQDKEDKRKGKKSRDGLSKGEKRFRKTFASEIVGPMPKLIDCYVCAYQGDILLQGKMFITDRYLCFYSRIINYVTKHVYRWEQIERVTTERVAFIFPTAIGIKLKELKRKVIYASFLSRDMAYEKIMSIWSKYNNITNSSEADENHSAPDVIVRSVNKNSRRKNEKRNSFEMGQASEADDFVEICLNGNDSNKRRGGSVSPKLNDEQTKSTNAVSSTSEKPNERYLKNSHKRSNQADSIDNIDKSIRYPRGAKLERDNNSPITRRGRSAVANTQSKKHSSIPNPTHTTDQALSLPEQTISHSTVSPTSSSSSSLPLIPNTNSSPASVNEANIPTKLLGLLMSFINLIIQTFSSLLHWFHIPATKKTTVIVLFVALVFFHSFYLITLAYRLENRLQSLHNRWPSTMMKNTFPAK